jgi:hypothetical protein
LPQAIIWRNAFQQDSVGRKMKKKIPAPAGIALNCLDRKTAVFPFTEQSKPILQKYKRQQLPPLLWHHDVSENLFFVSRYSRPEIFLKNKPKFREFDLHIDRLIMNNHC